MNLPTTLKHGILALSLALGILSCASLVSAQTQDLADQVGKDMTFDTRDAFPGSFGAKPGQKVGEGATLDQVAGRVISLMLQLMATLGIAVCIFGSYRMVTSMGNSGTLKKGQDAFLNAAIGTIIILLSYVIVAFVRDLILQVK
jgi:hypothetical protein